ncbi:CPP1-like family protein [Prochlorothrix hollandica]|uniref:Molecular chaperone DnaJ n=1 Tax=Prochlorothrix hollandica PCC 9006 = CALU 1027 TaxID=317619 RepID=A0A0M2PNG0_PROHO|nr:CPP1-like family protein [Prochlorothrix hollandica]KKI98150.1 molecular chaperone DnaJ [Prochlorothrix hollandica PCC 9006 = CALU 1027]
MSEHSPYEQLGVSEGASFDEIQEAKSRLMEQCGDDRKLMDSIETAYDAVLMHRLRMRQEGKIKVPDRIRFAEESAPKEPPRLAPSLQPNLTQLPGWMQQLVDNPSPTEVLWPALVFGVFGVVILVAPNPSSLLQLALVGGIGTSTYFLNRKEQRTGRAILLSFIGLGLGLFLGTLLYGLLQGLLSPLGVQGDQWATFTSLVTLWLVSSFLR